MTSLRESLGEKEWVHVCDSQGPPTTILPPFNIPPLHDLQSSLLELGNSTSGNLPGATKEDLIDDPGDDWGKSSQRDHDEGRPVPCDAGLLVTDHGSRREVLVVGGQQARSLDTDYTTSSSEHSSNEGRCIEWGPALDVVVVSDLIFPEGSCLTIFEGARI